MNICIVSGESPTAHALAWMLRKLESVGQLHSIASLDEVGHHLKHSEVDVVILELVADEQDGSEMVQITSDLYPDELIVYLSPIRVSNQTAQFLEYTNHVWIDSSGSLSSMIDQLEQCLKVELCERPLPELPSLKRFSMTELTILEATSNEVPAHILRMMVGKTEIEIQDFMAQAKQRMRASSHHEMLAVYQYAKAHSCSTDR